MGVSFFLVSSARCSDDRATRPCFDGENIVTLAHLIAQVISLTTECRFSSELGLRIVIGRVQWAFCRAQRHFSNVLVMVTPFRIRFANLACLGGGTHHAGHWRVGPV